MPGLAFTYVIDGDRRSSRVKIIAVGRQRQRRFGVDQFTQMAYLIRPLQSPFIARQPLYQITFAIVQAVNLFRPDAQQLAQRTREAAEIAQVRFVNNSRPVCCN